MTEKELVEKLKAELRKWLDELKADMEEEFKEGKGDKFEHYEEVLEKLNKAEKVKELTDWVRERSWDAEAWLQFILNTVVGKELELGDLARMDT